MQYVIDCSFSSALYLPDEESGDARNFFINLKEDDQVFVPILWWYETVNVLNISTKRKRLNRNHISIVITLLNKMNLITDFEYGAQFAEELFDLTQLYHVTSYDAAYLELAHRKRAKLMSLDEDLISAAKAIGIK